MLPWSRGYDTTLRRWQPRFESGWEHWDGHTATVEPEQTVMRRCLAHGEQRQVVNPVSLGPCPSRPNRKARWMAAKILTWSIIILIVVWIFSNPAGAGSDVHKWAGDLVGFFTHVSKG